MKNFIDKIEADKSSDYEGLNTAKVRTGEDWTNSNQKTREALAHAKVIKGLISKQKKSI